MAAEKTAFIIMVIIATIIIGIGILVLMGKGDWAISGYNTASPEKKAKYNIFRLRLLTGGTCTYVGIIMLVSTLCNLMGTPFIIIATAPVVIPVLVLTNTWAKRK